MKIHFNNFSTLIKLEGYSSLLRTGVKPHSLGNFLENFLKHSLYFSRIRVENCEFSTTRQIPIPLIPSGSCRRFLKAMIILHLLSTVGELRLNTQVVFPLDS